MKLAAVYSNVERDISEYSAEIARCDQYAQSLGLSPMFYVQNLELLIAGAEMNNIKDVIILSPMKSLANLRK